MMDRRWMQIVAYGQCDYVSVPVAVLCLEPQKPLTKLPPVAAVLSDSEDDLSLVELAGRGIVKVGTEHQVNLQGHVGKGDVAAALGVVVSEDVKAVVSMPSVESQVGDGDRSDSTQDKMETELVLASPRFVTAKAAAYSAPQQTQSALQQREQAVAQLTPAVALPVPCAAPLLADGGLGLVLRPIVAQQLSPADEGKPQQPCYLFQEQLLSQDKRRAVENTCWSLPPPP